ncbi:MAG: hypothetical protein HC944_03970 [Nanoarchaeota archaeon]|nr:hypothetical protein [Nanoarchaeota archaeon]
MNKITMGFLTLIILSTPMAFADSERDEKLEFAGTLEENTRTFLGIGDES